MHVKNIKHSLFFTLARSFYLCSSCGLFVVRALYACDINRRNTIFVRFSFLSQGGNVKERICMFCCLFNALGYSTLSTRTWNVTHFDGEFSEKKISAHTKCYVLTKLVDCNNDGMNELLLLCDAMLSKGRIMFNTFLQRISLC